MVSRSFYEERAVNACRSVMIELVHLLGEYNEHMVLIGGWIPSLTFIDPDEPHVGSLDIDLALDFKSIGDKAYKTIQELLVSRGYRNDDIQPFRYYRQLDNVTVELDLMAGEYGGTGRSRRTQKIQNVRARKVRGCDLAFDSCVSVRVDGELPGGGKDCVVMKIAGIVPFLIMKGFALGDRMKEKDAYDIYYCINNFDGGVKGLINAFEPFRQNRLVKESLDIIKDKFKSPGHIGPKWVTDFLEVDDNDEKAVIQRRAFELVNELMQELL